jgi:hypothetical protein
METKDKSNVTTTCPPTTHHVVVSILVTLVISFLVVTIIIVFFAKYMIYAYYRKAIKSYNAQFLKSCAAYVAEPYYTTFPDNATLDGLDMRTQYQHQVAGALLDICKKVSMANCSGIKVPLPHGFDSVTEIRDPQTSDVFAYVFKRKDACILAFTSSKTLRQWQEDVDFTQVPFDIFPLTAAMTSNPSNTKPATNPILVHKGFAAVVNRTWPLLIEAMKDVDMQTSYIFCTGHSQGGASSTLVVARLAAAAAAAAAKQQGMPTKSMTGDSQSTRSMTGDSQSTRRETSRLVSTRGSSVDLQSTKLYHFSFASPRCGNIAFANVFNDATLVPVQASWRLYNTEDIVPDLPPPVLESGWNYDHVGKSVSFTMNMDSVNDNHTHAYRIYFGIPIPASPSTKKEQ